MTGKRVPIGTRPVVTPGAERWLRNGDGAKEGVPPQRTELYGARLTVDVTLELRGRIKVAAFRQGITVADMLRTLLEREFPDGKGT